LESQVKTVHKTRRLFTSLGIILAALGLAYAPLPGVNRTLIIVGGTELQEPLQALEPEFERQNPNIQLELKFQGSQEMINRYLDNRNDFKPAVLIPANGELIDELGDRWRTQNQSDPFYDQPRPVAKTSLVAIAWAERGKVLFPDGKFSWQRLEKAMQAGNWAAIGGPANWGSFDFVLTDPTRSNSGQLTLSLWAEADLGKTSLGSTSLNVPRIGSLFQLVKRSVYEPPRSTDILLREFITRGPNDADVAIAYESNALYRWAQSTKTQGKPYQIYYLDQTIESTPTAVIVRRDIDGGTADAARQFVEFLTQSQPQAVLAQYGFRPINPAVDLNTVPNSPWKQGIPGAQITPQNRLLPSPDRQLLTEVIRQWERAN
jgi:ABC-type molybdate transport system substrate-binding protein